MNSTRRQVLTGLGLSTAAALIATQARSEPGSASQSQATGGELAPAHRGKHELVALPFDPKKLRGISEKLIVSHHENNYGGALRSLNKVEAALGSVSKDTAPFVVAGLKERELTFSNSVTLHELYFGNLGGDGKAAGDVSKALGETYGSLARWEEEFRATGASLGGGSGWVIVDVELSTGTLRTHWSGNHTQTKAGSLPLLVMDMYEHAYQMDYGAAATKYIDAFFENIRWEEVERRFASATKARRALKG
jgi:superoxide dismutase, Fe-Mn family